MTATRCAHPRTREEKVADWIASQNIGQDFNARQIAKALNLTRQDVGNLLKCQDNIEKVRRDYALGTIWQKVAA